MNVSPSRTTTAGAVGVGAFVLFGVVTGLVPNPVYARMVPRTPIDYAFLTLTAASLGLYAFQRVPAAGNDDKTATAGAILGFLAFGCPTCNAVLLALFGSSALMTYFEPLRPVVGAVSVAVFGSLLYVRSRRSCDECAPREATGHDAD
jgi:hypothetical protein